MISPGDIPTSYLDNIFGLFLGGEFNESKPLDVARLLVLRETTFVCVWGGGGGGRVIEMYIATNIVT